MRETVAISVCLLTAFLGAAAISLEWVSAIGAAMNVGTVWILASRWLTGDLSRRWKRIKQFRLGVHWSERPAMPSDAARLIQHGGIVLLAVGIITLACRRLNAFRL